jgi:ubiquinone/menaquinone biosynthesis C-methylase UbiE
MTRHDEAVRQEFAKQAATFEDPRYSFADPRLMRWILTNVPCEPGALVLDVAGGTGHVARAYADTAAFAIVLDLTREMLAAGKQEAEAADLDNVLFVLGDAARMPFLDHSFDLVVSRFAVHHFSQPAEQLGEMARVCRQGGRVAIVDLIAADGSLAAKQNELERTRDPSHTRALSVPELSQLLEKAATTVVHRTIHDQGLAVERWLAQARTPPKTRQAIRAELEAEIEGGAPTGMRPLIREDELYLTQSWAIVVAQKESTNPPVGSIT